MGRVYRIPSATEFRSLRCEPVKMIYRVVVRGFDNHVNNALVARMFNCDVDAVRCDRDNIGMRRFTLAFASIEARIAAVAFHGFPIGDNGCRLSVRAI
jgi:hypothetical protein